MKTLTLLLTLASFAVGSATSNSTVVLVHGAFAGGTSWAKLIPILESDGHTAIAVQNPPTSLADDVRPLSGSFVPGGPGSCHRRLLRGAVIYRRCSRQSKREGVGLHRGLHAVLVILLKPRRKTIIFHLFSKG